MECHMLTNGLVQLKSQIVPSWVGQCELMPQNNLTHSHLQRPHPQLMILAEGEDEGVFLQFSDSEAEDKIIWTVLPTDCCGHPPRQPLHHGAPLELQDGHTTWNKANKAAKQQKPGPRKETKGVNRSMRSSLPCVSCGGRVTTTIPPAGGARA